MALYKMGRVLATTWDDALSKVQQEIEASGYISGPVKLWPCNVQCYPGLIWLEWVAEVNRDCRQLYDLWRIYNPSPQHIQNQ